MSPGLRRAIAIEQRSVERDLRDALRTLRSVIKRRQTIQHIARRAKKIRIARDREARRRD